MSQSTTPQSSNRAVLCQCGHELSEFAELLAELAVSVDECTTDFPDPRQLEGARLVIVSGKRLLESGAPDLSLWPRTIAVVDDSSRTMVTHLGRLGVALVIRRPVHPRTLRLLLLHEIYRGPERRGRKRILVGHPIRISSGLFRPHATLLELSPTGARIELANAPKVGTRIRILIGREMTKGRPLRLRAKVIRSIRASSENNRVDSEIGVAILDPDEHAKTIQGMLDRFALGPASLKSKRTHDEPTTDRAALLSNAGTIGREAGCELPPTRTTFREPTVETEIEAGLSDDFIATERLAPPSEMDKVTSEAAIPDPLDANPDEPQKNGEDSAERRRDPRVPYEQRVVALDEEAARVLVGRDLCRGGMRITAMASIAVGDVLRVALHSGAQTEPLIVLANVSRDDGDDGLVLSFDELSKAQRERLDKIISVGLPFHANADDPRDPSEIGEEIVVAEMLGTVRSKDDIDRADRA